MKSKIMKTFRLLLAFCLLATMSGCFYWWRAYQTYLQMDEFDEYFAVSVADSFTVHFKEPILLSEDFVSLAKLEPSEIEPVADGEIWKYHFRKVEQDGRISMPEVRFSFDLAFGRENKIRTWSFSPLFLQIAPPEFLELSFRSLGAAEINQDKKQMKVDTDKVKKIDADLPLKSTVIGKLGDPLEIKDKDDREEYLYHFELETDQIEEGYEDRALSVVKLTFDKKTWEMIKMSGRFAGLKISINYRNYQQQKQDREGRTAAAGSAVPG